MTATFLLLAFILVLGRIGVSKQQPVTFAVRFNEKYVQGIHFHDRETIRYSVCYCDNSMHKQLQLVQRKRVGFNSSQSFTAHFPVTWHPYWIMEHWLDIDDWRKIKLNYFLETNNQDTKGKRKRDVPSDVWRRFWRIQFQFQYHSNLLGQNQKCSQLTFANVINHVLKKLYMVCARILMKT